MEAKERLRSVKLRGSHPPTIMMPAHDISQCRVPPAALRECTDGPHHATSQPGACAVCGAV